MKALRLVFADSLCIDATLFAEADKERDVFLFMEVHDEFSYVRHHVKKIIFLLSAMRHYALALEAQGFQVRYIKHDDPHNQQSFYKEIQRAIQALKPKQVDFMTPGEYRVRKDILSVLSQCEVKYKEHHDAKFIISHDQFKQWAKGKKSLQMENFYRLVRRQLNILMDEDKPVGGKWNYDSLNRQKPPKDFKANPPRHFPPDDITQELIESLMPKLKGHMGDEHRFYFAVTRQQALTVLKYFIKHNLATFGAYQDAMLHDEPWMAHSHLSFYLNIGLLKPMECIEAAVVAYEKEQAPINSVEGFIRQILGWREYIRGVYWLNMPQYQQANALKANEALPAWFWTGQTKMACMNQCLTQTIDNAYAHHIQRLMVIGNYCLLTGVKPQEVQAWYLAVYADAFEWVELPNVQGMILYADNGLMSSKPYAASGAYIKKMSNYCDHCQFSVKEKTGDKACPFNYLYWYFMHKNKAILKSNHRLGITLKQLEKMEPSKLAAMIESAKAFINDPQ